MLVVLIELDLDDFVVVIVCHPITATTTAVVIVAAAIVRLEEGRREQRLILVVVHLAVVQIECDLDRIATGVGSPPRVGLLAWLLLCQVERIDLAPSRRWWSVPATRNSAAARPSGVE